MEQAEFVVLAWYMLQETGSAFQLGVYASLRFAGTLFSPLYGVLVDKYDRRRLILMTRLTFLMNTILILLLAASDALTVWWVLGFAGITGLARALDTITRQTIVPDIVSPNDLMNGVALLRTGRDITQIIGPVLGGFLLSTWSMTNSYIVFSGLYAVGAVLSFKLKSIHANGIGRDLSITRNIVKALVYVRNHNVILALLLMAFLVNLTGFPLNQGLIPAFVKTVLEGDASNLGQLMAAYAAGSMLASVAIAALPGVSRPGMMIIVGALGWHVGMLFFALNYWFKVSLVLLALTGASQSITMVTMSMVILRTTSPNVRGRVMGLRSLAVYGLPIGLLISGGVADIWTIQIALLINAIVGIVFGIGITISISSLWRYR